MHRAKHLLDKHSNKFMLQFSYKRSLLLYNDYKTYIFETVSLNIKHITCKTFAYETYSIRFRRRFAN